MNKDDLRFLTVAQQALKNYRLEKRDIDENAKIGDIGFSGYRMIKFRVSGAPNDFLITVYDAKGDRIIQDHQPAICSHLIWLESLSRDTDLVVQKPVRNESGNLITRIQIGSRNYLVTLLTWVKGELVWNTDAEGGIHLPPEMLYRVGAILGQLHQHSANWSPPEDFIRPKSETEDLSANLRPIRHAVDAGRINASDFTVLEQMVDRFQSEVSKLGRTPLTWGLLHGDFSCGNCVAFGDEVRPIDFDWCCFGYYAGDLGWALSKEMDAPLRQAFLDGYQQYFDLPYNTQHILGGFFLEAHIRILSWESRNPKSDLSYVPHLVDKACLKYLNAEPFFLQYKEEAANNGVNQKRR